MSKPYEDLIRRLRECTPEQNGEKTLWHEAADAIEELQKAVNFHKFNSEFWEDKYNNLADEKWIPVTERLPEGKTNVLCCGANGGMFVGWTGLYDFEGKVMAFVHGGSGRNITHWMPLPEPPKGE